MLVYLLDRYQVAYGLYNLTELSVNILSFIFKEY